MSLAIFGFIFGEYQLLGDPERKQDPRRRAPLRPDTDGPMTDFTGPGARQGPPAPLLPAPSHANTAAPRPRGAPACRSLRARAHEPRI
eukprot:CAMPEP_0119522336 /NCGR_PEP_ID=MMETSP1344-20130328/37744_1 /TAXON_ID=236787 /ORGANISM="Florenciella parvula, Strain CCMP2471" /LENGTH=87 /DNA_ID=CAMNT_0007560371 /DNA_START=244 /DNA_END=504 /DNA_ORIENTATION=+